MHCVYERLPFSRRRRCRCCRRTASSRWFSRNENETFRFFTMWWRCCVAWSSIFESFIANYGRSEYFSKLWIGWRRAMEQTKVPTKNKCAKYVKIRRQWTTWRVTNAIVRRWLRSQSSPYNNRRVCTSQKWEQNRSHFIVIMLKYVTFVLSTILWHRNCDW